MCTVIHSRRWWRNSPIYRTTKSTLRTNQEISISNHISHFKGITLVVVLTTTDRMQVVLKHQNKINLQLWTPKLMQVESNILQLLLLLLHPSKNNKLAIKVTSTSSSSNNKVTRIIPFSLRHKAIKLLRIATTTIILILTITNTTTKEGIITLIALQILAACRMLLIILLTPAT